MVQAMINIKERSNKVLNIIRALHSLKNKSEAIDFVMKDYEEKLLQQELRPEFIKEIQEMEKNGKFKKYSSVKQLYDEVEGTPS